VELARAPYDLHAGHSNPVAGGSQGGEGVLFVDLGVGKCIRGWSGVLTRTTFFHDGSRTFEPLRKPVVYGGPFSALPDASSSACFR